MGANVKVIPVAQLYRRIPIPLEDTSRCISSIVPIIKGNGEVRICIDMRRANQAISRENQPLPTIANAITKTEKS